MNELHKAASSLDSLIQALDEFLAGEAVIKIKDLTKERDELKAELAALKASMEPRLIETAPMSGEVLAWSLEFNCWVMAERLPTGWDWPSDSECDEDTFYQVCPFWLPMPPAPSAAKEVE